MLTLTTLGAVGLTQGNGASITRVLTQPKRFAVLVYLAHHTRRSVLRDELRGVFWPETSDALSRRALNQALYGLRSALGAGIIESLSAVALRINGDHLQCDSSLFERAVESRSFGEALKLFRGDFLPGFAVPRVPDFERWVEDTRSRLRFQASGAAAELFKSARREARRTEALHWARRRLELDSTDESALRDLLTTLVEAGDRAEAVATYREFARHLATDLEVAPSSQTQALARSLKSEALAATVPATGHVVVARSMPAPRVTARRRLSVAVACLVVALGVGEFAYRQFVGQSDPEAAEQRTTAEQLTRVGRVFWSRRDDESLRSAVQFFSQATTADARYAPAYSGLADAYTLDAWYGDSESATNAANARAAALAAVRLDDRLAQAHTSLGGVKAWFDHDWGGAEAEYRRALSLDSGYATAHQWFALGLAVHDRLAEATREMQIAQRHDPLSPSIATDLAMLLFWSGRDQAAIAQIRYALTLDPGSLRASAQLWRIYSAAGKSDEAVTALARVVGARGGGAGAGVRERLRGVYARRGLQGVMLWWAATLERSPRTPDRAMRIAVLDGLLDRKAEALRWLRQARDEHSQFLQFAVLDPAFRGLRTDPQFVGLVSTR